MQLQRGFRDKLSNYLNTDNDIQIHINISGSAVYDYSCFGVDADNKLSDDRYMVFYNQTKSPNGEISYTPESNGAEFTVNLGKLPPSVNKLVFTASIDGNGTMGDINSHSISVVQKNETLLTMSLNGGDFHNEKAVISIEIYRKDGWRIAAVASGFNGGLSELLKFYGGVEAKVTEPPQKTPQKVSLKKGQKVSLDKNDEGKPIIIENGWTAAGKDYDLKALVRYRNGKLIYVGAANDDESLSTPEGAVKHGGDIKSPGELEHIYVSWHPDIASVAVSSYSALENGTGSFYEYGVFVRIRNGSQVVEIPASDTSANPRSYTLCFGEILFGKSQGSMEVSALEMYSQPNSEARIGYKGDKVMMDIGPVGQLKG